MQQQGEFEQKTEIKPTNQASKPKASPLPWILCVVFALIACGVIVWKLMDSDKGTTKKCTNPVAEQKNDISGSVAVRDAVSDDRVRVIIKKLRSDLMDYFGETFDSETYKTLYEVENNFDFAPIDYEFEDGYSTGIDKTYSVTFMSADGGFYIGNKANSSTFKADLDKMMANYGLKRTDDSSDTSHKYNDDSGSICVLDAIGEPLYLGCTNSNWLSDEDKAFAKELIDAYKKGQESLKDAKTVYVDAEPEGIEKSKVDGYEIVSGAVDGAVALFYRKDGGEWTFALATQSAVPCEEYKKHGVPDGVFPCENLN